MIARITINAYELHPSQKTALAALLGVETVGWNTEAIVDLDAVLPALAEMGIEPKVKAIKNAMLVGLREKIACLETEQKLLRQQIATDGLVAQIHIPNQSLYSVNEVALLPDACTNELQGMLDEGWRLLCVCPPNSQRRPDYILGRHNKEKHD